MRRWKNRGSIAYPDADKKLTALHYGLFADAATFEAMPAPPPGVPVTIIHGRADVVVPIDVSRRYVDRYRDAAPRLIEVDDDHRLEASLADVTRAIGEAFGLPLEPSVENRDLPRG
jgi:pimeloyl-ACP methyl ester carboxylesterase